MFMECLEILDVRHKVKCSATAMTVEMMLNDNVTDVYLEGMKRIGKDIGNSSHRFQSITIDGGSVGFDWLIWPWLTSHPMLIEWIQVDCLHSTREDMVNAAFTLIDFRLHSW